MATYGNVGEFNESEESWTQYAERLEQCFAANEIKDEKKQGAILLRVNASKNQRKFKKCGHGRKIDFAHTLPV